MKKILLSLVALMAMSVQTALAQAYKTLSFPDENQANNALGAYDQTWEAKIGEDTWTIANFNNNKWNNWTYIKCGRKSAASTASIATAFAIDKAIENVCVTVDALKNADKINSVSLLVASDAEFATVDETVNANLTAAGNLIFNITSPAANKYYKLVFDIAVAGSNGIIQISKVQYNEAGAVILEPAGISYARKQYDITLGEEVEFVTLSNPNNLPVTYASSNTEVATIDAEGNVTVVGVGTTTISATTEKTDKYDAGYACYVINVTEYIEPDPSEDITNTPETAYTVAQANELIAAGKGLDSKVYVAGTITEIKEVSTQYGNATFWIGDEATRGEADLQIYHGYFLENQKFTAENQIKVGDKVVMYGLLVDYNGTKEMKTVYVYSLNGNQTVGIRGIEAGKNSQSIYNLAGQRVGKAVKGIYVINGKKVVK